MDNIIVYTDRKGNVERVLEVTTGDIWKFNDIQQDMMLMEERGEDYEVQRSVLQSMYGEERAHFRTKGERAQTTGKNRKGTGRNARSVGKGDSEEVSSQKAWGTQGVLNSEDKYSLREETEDDLTRQHLENMEPTDSMSDSEKWLLDKYQRTQAELAEKETQIAEQERLATSAGKHSQPR